jgi:hypothetical protein
LDDKAVDVELEIDKIILALAARLYDNNLELLKSEIKYIDFVQEVCYYSVVNKKTKLIIKDKFELELEITKFKTQLGE